MCRKAVRFEFLNWLKYRLKQAKESIDEATFLLSGKKSPRSIIKVLWQKGSLKEAVSAIRPDMLVLAIEGVIGIKS